MKKLLLLFLILMPALLFAQTNITGRVINIETKAPVADASVFLSNSGVGDKTQKDGSFSLRNVKNGRYDLVVSCVGYMAYKKTITVNDADIRLPAIELTEKIGELGEVKIRYQSKSDRAWYLRMFTKAFLGSSSNSWQCKIANPDVLDFDYSKKQKKLTASTSEFLIIDNKALGYRIRYLVYSFMTDSSGATSYVGASSFEPMKGNPLQQKVWQNRRADAYFGSTMHFLRSCIADAVNENKFTVRELIKPAYRPSDSVILRKLRHFKSELFMNERDYLAARDLKDSIAYWQALYRGATAMDRILKLHEYIKLTNEKGIYAFGYRSKAVVLNYRNKPNIIDRYSSFVTFLQPDVFFDSNGVIFTPADCLFEGYWQYLRVADQLPVDYELPQENAIQQAAMPDRDDKVSH